MQLDGSSKKKKKISTNACKPAGFVMSHCDIFTANVIENRTKTNCKPLDSSTVKSCCCDRYSLEFSLSEICRAFPEKDVFWMEANVAF